MIYHINTSQKTAECQTKYLQEQKTLPGIKMTIF